MTKGRNLALKGTSSIRKVHGNKQVNSARSTCKTKLYFLATNNEHFENKKNNFQHHQKE